MKVKFFDRQNGDNEDNGSEIKNLSKLRIILKKQKGNVPFFFELVCDNDTNLLVGFGFEYGCIQHSSNDGLPPYLMLINEENLSSTEYCEFLIGNTPTPISKKYCVNINLLYKVISLYLKNGEISDDFAWEEI